MMSILEVSNNFIKKRIAKKSNDCLSELVRGHCF